MDPKITVLHIAECAGGVERYIQMLLPRLEKKGFCQFFLKQMDLKQTFSPLQVLRKVLSIRKYIKKLCPDIVYCHSSFAGGLGRLAAWGLPCKIVYNPHGWAFNIR